MPKYFLRYFHGWVIAMWIVSKVRAKRHGAGRLPWRLALRAGAAARFVVDGQHRRPRRVPWYLRRVFSY